MHAQQPNLVRLMYASRITKECGPKELEDILNVSRRNNKTLGVTGALCYSARGFLQCLEGSRTAVNELYRRIVQDTRNEDVTLITYAHIEERAFGQWSMAYVRADEVDQAILRRHGIAGTFDPYALNADQALGLLRDTARERAAFLARQTE
jgi:hypothetical protein